ncbi:MAG: hypothetical protein ACRYFL_03655 [Janthinobacterium lividum]
MKTSNKLFIAAVLIIVISMIGYDLALRAEYRKGEYKKPFYGMENINFNDFTTIDNRAANLISVKAEKGNESAIWVEKEWKKHLKISKNGTTLVIEVVDKKVSRLHSYQNNITIICPSLEKVITNPISNAKLSESYDSEGTTTIKGFDLKNLVLNIGKCSGLILEKNNINSLQAIVGSNSSENARLTIGSDNQINVAIVKVPGKNFLTVENPTITTKNFTISDSATVSTSGHFFNQIHN